MTIKDVIQAYGIPSITKQELVESQVDDDQRQRLLNADSRDVVYRVLAELAEVAKRDGKPYVHP